MNYSALACDYDGTLACNGIVDKTTVAALSRFRASGRKLLLVTGRQLRELLALFPEAGQFQWIVAENGALLYEPATGREQLLAAPPPERLAEMLRQRGVQPLALGRVIVATREPHESTVLAVIRELGLELQVIFNKGAVMVLPTGVNKATGLTAALQKLSLPPTRVAAIGDAENDHAFLDLCGLSAAVANAIPAIKERATWVAPSPAGAGVVELIDQILSPDPPAAKEGARSVLFQG